MIKKLPSPRDKQQDLCIDPVAILEPLAQQNRDTCDMLSDVARTPGSRESGV